MTTVERCPRHGRLFPCEPCEREIDRREFEAAYPLDEPERGEREYERFLDRIGGSR